jgi:protein-export membrane protein SecD
LKSASVQFASGASVALAAPEVLLNFNSAGAALFEKITADNVGQTLAIFLDGQPISTPVIQEAIPGGTAVITGSFTPAQARDLAQNLSFGALPVPISLESSSTVGPTLGAAAIAAGVVAGMLGFAIVALFMIAWYRLPGVIAAVALAEYLAFMLAAIKIIPVTLTASGIAGLIISLGIAVDANVLIFERMKEELREGKEPREAVHIGFARAWTAIRDGHLTMLIAGVILFWLGTSIVQGFALVFILGVLASFISAVSLSRVFLLAIVPEHKSSLWQWLLGSGFFNKQSLPK